MTGCNRLRNGAARLTSLPDGVLCVGVNGFVGCVGGDQFNGAARGHARPHGHALQESPDIRTAMHCREIVLACLATPTEKSALTKTHSRSQRSQRSLIAQLHPTTRCSQEVAMRCTRPYSSLVALSQVRPTWPLSPPL